MAKVEARDQEKGSAVRATERATARASGRSTERAAVRAADPASPPRPSKDPAAGKAHPLRSLLKEVFSGALLWSGLAYLFIRPITVPAERLIYNLGPALSMLAYALGILAVLLVVALMGGKRRVNAYYIAYGCFIYLRIAAYLLAQRGQFVAPLCALYYLASGASFALFVTAWCQYFSEKREAGKYSLIAPSVFYTTAFIIILTTLPQQLVALIAVAAMVVPGIVLMILRDRDDEVPLSGDGLTRQRKVVFFVYGVMIGALMIVCPVLNSSNISANLDSFPWREVVWIIATLAFGTICLRFVNWQPGEERYLQLLFPLLILVFLSPPLLFYGINAIFPIVLLYTIICEAVVFATGRSGTFVTITIGSRELVFWERSIMLLGFTLGSLGSALLAPFISLEALYSVPFAVAFLYLAMALVTVFMKDKVFESQHESGGYFTAIEQVAQQVAADYSLTPRETEVFQELAQGRSLPYIQEKLFISKGTATSHLNHIYQKLGINRRQELLDLAQSYLD